MRVVIEMNIESKRGRGNPKKMWIDRIESGNMKIADDVGLWCIQTRYKKSKSDCGVGLGWLSDWLNLVGSVRWSRRKGIIGGGRWIAIISWICLDKRNVFFLNLLLKL